MYSIAAYEFCVRKHVCNRVVHLKDLGNIPTHQPHKRKSLAHNYYKNITHIFKKSFTPKLSTSVSVSRT
jgi:hypothetical protein